MLVENDTDRRVGESEELEICRLVICANRMLVDY